MGTVGIFFVVALLHTVNAQTTPSISYISEKQIKDIDDIVELQCVVQNQQEFPVGWVKINEEGEAPISSGEALVTRDNRYSLRYDAASSTYALQIKDIKTTDSGNYQCEIRLNSDSILSAQVELEVRTRPVITDNSTSSVVVDEGSPIKLECYAEGFPTPKISWRRENNVVIATGSSSQGGNVLNIESATKEDSGDYFCIAQNGVGRGSRRTVSVRVKYAPIVTTELPRVGQAVGYPANLGCRIEGYPSPAITWYKDGLKLPYSQEQSVSNFGGSANDAIQTILHFARVENQHYGYYICRAENDLGSADSKVELFETTDKICPPACD